MTLKMIDAALALFEVDPPDSAFQEGYRQALLDLRERLLSTQ